MDEPDQHADAGAVAMPCDRCGNGVYLPSAKPMVAERDGRLVVVTSVPVERCHSCGETLIADRTAEWLAELFDDALAVNQVTVRAWGPPVTPAVTGVAVVDRCRITVEFADSRLVVYDFTHRLTGPAFAAVREDPAVFAIARLEPEAGTLVWPVGDDRHAWPDWAPEELYENGVPLLQADLAGFTGAGFGTVRVPSWVRLRHGDRVAITDDEADVLDAVVVSVTQDRAEVRLTPLLIQDDSFDPHPMGHPAWSRDPGNRGCHHPLPVGALVWSRDMSESPASEWLGQVTWCEGDPVEGWRYRVLPGRPR